MKNLASIIDGIRTFTPGAAAVGLPGMTDPPEADSGIDIAATRLRIGAAAASLGVSVDTLRRWERDGRIQFERVGGQRVIASSEIDRLLRERPAVARRSSARNRLEGTIVAIKRGRVMSQVELGRTRRLCGHSGERHHPRSRSRARQQRATVDLVHSTSSYNL